MRITLENLCRHLIQSFKFLENNEDTILEIQINNGSENYSLITDILDHIKLRDPHLHKKLEERFKSSL